VPRGVRRRLPVERVKGTDSERATTMKDKPHVPSTRQHIMGALSFWKKQKPANNVNDSKKEQGENDEFEQHRLPLAATAVSSPIQRWLTSFYRSDPRWQVYNFFKRLQPGASVFTVWRPTSVDAIRRMIAGDAVGKGLEIKGKSAHSGVLSGYVPFLQIDQEEHKSKIRTIPRKGRVRVYYTSQQARDAALAQLEPLQDHMLNTLQDAKRIVKKSAIAAGNLLGAEYAVSTLKQSGKQVSQLARGSWAQGSQRLSGFSQQSGLSAATKAIGSFSQKAGSVASNSLGMDSPVGRSFRNSISHVSSSLLWSPQKGESETEWAMKRLLWDMDDPSIQAIDDYALDNLFGIEMPDRLLWQAYVMDKDISRPQGSDYYTGRPSQPAFQDMNLIAIYKTRKNQTASRKCKKGEPRVVLWQTKTHDDNDVSSDPLDPRGLIMAYEEQGRVLPVVSDFDCFTMGTRGIRYDTALPKDQMELMQWCVSQIEIVLEAQDANEDSKSSSWTARWLEILKTNSMRGFHPEIPRYGFGDELSYSITEKVVRSLHLNGGVRHGAESFNFYFPQELDSEFLIISDALPGRVPWCYVGVDDLQKFLLQRAEDGFAFPLNPKWILCDEKWKEIYDRLLHCQRPDVQEAMNIWYPEDSGIRGDIERIAKRFPDGFVYHKPAGEPTFSGTEAMDLAELELDQFLALRRAKAKLRAIVAFTILLHKVRRISADKAAMPDSGAGAATENNNTTQNKSVA